MSQTTELDHLASYSNFGKREVAFAAPGGDVDFSLLTFDEDGNIVSLGPNCTRLHFDEQADMDPEVYAFINRHNEDHMRAASQYLTDHSEYRPDLVDPQS